MKQNDREIFRSALVYFYFVHFVWQFLCGAYIIVYRIVL